MNYVAIDPGIGGGIAAADARGAWAWDMPYTPKDIYDMLKTLHEPGCVCYLEDVGYGRPGQSIKATSTFARHNGHLEMALIALGYRIIKITPNKWQKKLGLLSKKGETKTAHKNRMKSKAQQLFPTARVTLKTADALLILEYALEEEK